MSLKDKAYVCLLHGDDEPFFLYAMVVGWRVKRLCSNGPDAPDRVLLCSGRWWMDVSARKALGEVFTLVQEVKLIKAPHATIHPRHVSVFTKIHRFMLPYRKVVFLNLELVRSPHLDFRSGRLYDLNIKLGSLFNCD